MVFITAKDNPEAKRISRALLNQKLAACVNIIKGVKSFFWWEGKVDKASEVLLIVKTQKRLFPKLAKAVKIIHSYSTPEIIAIPILAGEKAYLDWIRQSMISQKKGDK